MKNVIFDLDNTLTKSRSPIRKNHARILTELASRTGVAVISGATVEQIETQLGDIPRLALLGQNGNDARWQRRQLWLNNLNWLEKMQIYRHIYNITCYAKGNRLDWFEDRGSQISFSFLGHNADKAAKKRFDPKGKKRRAILEKYPFISEQVDVKIGGTTCLDYFKKGYDKGRNIKMLMSFRGWKAEDCVYLGDALFKGGNDESVIGVCETVQVNSPGETFKWITQYLQKNHDKV